MKSMVLYELDLSFVKSETFINQWVLYHVETADMTLKDLLEAMGVPYTSYAYARKNGFLGSKKVLNAIVEYFNLTLAVNDDVFEKLEHLVHRAITESYFIKVENLNKIQEELNPFKASLTKSPLYLLYALTYLSAFDHFKMENFKDEIESDILPFLEFVEPVMSYDAQYFFMFSKTEYFFNVNRDAEAITLIDKYEALDPHVNERLKTMGYYDLFTLYALDRNFARCLVYMEKCYDLTFKYYNVERLKAIRQNRTAVLFNHESYEEALANARGDLLFIYRQDMQANQMFFKILIVVIVSSLIKLKRYDEALKEVEMFFDYNLEDYYGQGLLLKAFCYYKLNDTKGFEKIDAQLESYEKNGLDFPDRYYALADLLAMIKRRKKNEMKKFGSMLKPYRDEQVFHYNRIAKLLEEEYISYLKENNNYIDVLDM